MILIIRKGIAVVNTIELGEGDYIVGRSPNADIILDDTEVSKKHARITFKDGKHFIEDLGSSNGLYLGKSKILRSELTPETPIEIGPFRLMMSSSEEATVMAISEGSLSIEEKTKLNPSGKHEADPFDEAISIEPGDGRQKSEDLSKKYEVDEEETLEHISDDIVEAEEDTNAQARLIQLNGEKKGREINLHQDEVTLGIKDTADIEVDGEGEDSFEKAKILRRKDQFFFEDARTIVNPEMQAPLKDQQELQIGANRFRFEAVHEEKKTSSSSKILERQRNIKKWEFGTWIKDWRFLLLGSLFLSFVIVAIIQSQDRPKPIAGQSQNQLSSEDQRLELFHLSEAQKALAQGDFSKALASVDLVLKDISPNSKEANQLKAEILLQQSQAAARREEKRRRLEANREKIQGLLSKGEEALEKKNLDDARAAFKEVLTVDEKSVEAKSGLDSIAKVEKELQEKAARERAYDLKLTRDYEKGVSAFESGDYKSASRILSPIARRAGHRYQSDAKNILARIESLAKERTKEKVKEAQTLAEAGELRAAYDELQGLQKKYPKNQDVDQAMKRIQQQMHLKAKDLYTKGLASEELLEDISGALDYYKEALKYAPNPEDEYHRKASEKVNQLELAP